MIVEDEPEIAGMIERTLQSEGSITIVGDLSAFKAYASTAVAPALAVVDLGLPDGSFLSLARDDAWRRRLEAWPILFVSLQDEIGIIEAMLDGPKRDYLTKPLNRNLLLAKARRLLTPAPEVLRLCPLSFRVKHAARESEQLTALESKLFNALLHAGSTGLERRSIAAAIYGETVARGKIDVALTRLRKKLAPLDIRLTTSDDSRVVISAGDTDRS